VFLMKNIKYNRAKCIGCGICATRSAHIWIISAADGKADLIDSVLKKDFQIRVLWNDETSLMHEIVILCPTKAIQLI